MINNDLNRVDSSVNLLTRLPPFLQKYDEIVRIATAQGAEFDIVWTLEQWMRRQIFIITAEEYGLMRYERMLGITPMQGESFAARRNHILLHWNKEPPHTMRFLIALLEALTNGNFEIITNFHEYNMEIRVFTLDSGIISNLAFILRHIIPVNIALTSSNHININLRGFIRFAAMVDTVRHYTITQDFRTHYTMVGHINQAGAVTKTRTHTFIQGVDGFMKTEAQKIGNGAVVMQNKLIPISNAFNAEISMNAKVAAVGSVVKIIEYKI